MDTLVIAHRPRHARRDDRPVLHKILGHPFLFGSFFAIGLWGMALGFAEAALFTLILR